MSAAKVQPKKAAPKSGAKSPAKSTPAKTAVKSATKSPAKAPVKSTAKVAAKKPAAAKSAKPPAKSPVKAAAPKAAASSAKKPAASAKSPAKSTAKKPAAAEKSGGSLKKLMANQPLPFEVGTHIFYPQEGLGFITKLEERVFNGEPTLYYVISFPSQKMTSHIPVKNAKMVKIRKTISKPIAQKILRTIATMEEKPDVSWKDRLSLYQEILLKSNPTEMAEIVVTLFLRKKIKPLSFQERQYYEFSLEALIGEISVALDISREEANEKIHQALTELVSSRAKKHK